MRTFPVRRSDRRPLLDFFIEGLAKAGCKILYRPDPGSAPFRIVFETPWQERIGVVLYGFRCTARATKNRPADEARFQVKYGPRTKEMHHLFDDPFHLYITLFMGFDLESGIVVSADPAIHNPTLFYISIEYKQEDVRLSQEKSWHVWERSKRGHEERNEVLLGCIQERILDVIMFERMAQNLDQGHRQLLAEKVASTSSSRDLIALQRSYDPDRHKLLAELAVEPDALFNIIQSANRLKTAVRGWVAQHHLHGLISQVAGVQQCEQIEEDGKPDFRVTLAGGRAILIECKNVLRKTSAQGLPRVDFQRTRASVSDPCSRYYSKSDFEILAACLHPISERWEFMYKRVDEMAPHQSCQGKLSSNVLVNGSWTDDLGNLLNFV